MRADKHIQYRPNQVRIIRSTDNRLVQLGNIRSPVTPSVTGPVATDTGMRRLQFGDRLDVQVRGPVSENLKCVVDENGNLNLPLIGSIKVAGKTPSEAEKMIETAYITGEFYKQITVIIVPPEAEFVVQGEVIKPGSYPISSDITLMQALGKAGRYTDFADITMIKLIRGKDITIINAKRIEKGQEPDITVKPGDVIIVPRGWM
jgi:polysaccharide export outer membrane protein